jgi:hypothetical protein
MLSGAVMRGEQEGGPDILFSVGIVWPAPLLNDY